MVLLRLATKNSPNNSTVTIQNLGEKILSRKEAASAASPVAFYPEEWPNKRKLRNEYRG